MIVREVKMSQLEYLVPDTLEEAVELLKRGVPLAGGSSLTPRRGDLKSVIDIRNLGLDGIRFEGNIFEIGAATKLQMLIEAQAPIPMALRDVCRREAGWNLRNMASLGGAIMSSDGRSGLLTTLLALKAEISQAPGPEVQPLHEFLLARNKAQLVTHIRFPLLTRLLYEQVARTPADWPLVSAAVGYTQEEDEEPVTISIGGFGDFPIRLMEAERVFQQSKDPEQTGNLVQEAYKNAGDKWASAEYRSEIAGVLVRRLLREVQS
jgi:probable selenate reductase FAD-binding subunit